jgi:hypothetical protein
VTFAAQQTEVRSGLNSDIRCIAAVYHAFFARCAPEAQGERLRGEEDGSMVRWTIVLTSAGWRFGGRALCLSVAMTVLG